MKTNTTNTTMTNDVNIADETSKFALKVGIVSASIIGLWGVACLVSALVATGPTGLAAGYLVALGL